MEERYDSTLFAPIEDKGLLEGMVLLTLNELGIDEDGLSLFRREFEQNRDILVNARKSGDAPQVDRITKQALKYVPKYTNLDTLDTDLNLTPNVWVNYEQKHGNLERNQPGQTNPQELH